MFHPIKTIMQCSQCGSKNIVAPCNEDTIDFRCLDCGHEKESGMQVRSCEIKMYTSSTSDINPAIIKPPSGFP